MKKSFLPLAAALCFLAGLSACGGGGDSGGATVTPAAASVVPEGVYEGAISSLNFELVVLEDGTTWVLTGVRDSAGTLMVSSMSQGKGFATGASFNVADLKSFSSTGAVTTSTITATFALNGSFTGAETVNGASTPFFGAPMAISEFNYSTPAIQSAISGAWNFTSMDGSSDQINVSNSGAFSVSKNGCTTSGSITPRPSGKNVYNVSLVAGPAPCPRPGFSASGIAIVSKTGQLVVAVTNGDRTAGDASFGSR